MTGIAIGNIVMCISIIVKKIRHQQRYKAVAINFVICPQKNKANITYNKATVKNKAVLGCKSKANGPQHPCSFFLCYPDPNQLFLKWIRIREKKSVWIRIRQNAVDPDPDPKCCFPSLRNND